MKIIGYREVSFRFTRGRKIGDANGVASGEGQTGGLLFIDSDEGLYGISQIFGASVAPLFPLLEGEDPRCVTGLWEKLNRHLFKFGNQGATYLAMMAIDAALWDLKAKLAGEPLWRLLGARKPRVKAYASGLDLGLNDEELAAFYQPFARCGVDAGKLKVGVDLETDLRRLGIVRDVLAQNGRTPHLIIDANEIWGVKQAVGAIRRFEEKFHLAWVEEPIGRWNYKGYQRLAAAVRSPLGTGENLGAVQEYLPLFDHGGVDVIQFGKNRGVTVPLQLAHLAAAHELAVSYNHSWGGYLAHAAAAMPNTIMMEIQDLQPPPCLTVDTCLEEGWFIVGNTPGWGITVNEEKLEAMRVEPGNPSGRPGTGPHIRRLGAGVITHPPLPEEGFYGE